MKKKIMLSIGVLAIAVVVSLNINLAKTDLSSLAFMNIQALAGETGGGESGLSGLSNGCDTLETEVLSNNSKHIRRQCVGGNENSCQYGKEVIVNGITQAGSEMTTYTCRTAKK